jgi:hypothetical protein
MDAVDVVSGIKADQEKYFPVCVFQEFHSKICQVFRVSYGSFSVLDGSVFDHMDFDNVYFGEFFRFHGFSPFRLMYWDWVVRKQRSRPFGGPAFCSEMVWLSLWLIRRETIRSSGR